MKVPKPRKLPSGSWFIQMRLGGVSVPVTAPTEKECVRRAQLVKAEYQAGKRVISRQGGSLTLGEAIDRYIESNSNTLSPSTLRGYGIIRRNRFQGIMEAPITSIANWQRVVNAEAKLCSAKTLKNAWGLVGAVLKDNGLAVPPVKLAPLIKKEALWLDPEQIPVFVEAVSKESFAVSALLALHSLRRSEIYAVAQSGGIDLERGVIKVHGAVVPNEQHKFVYKETNKTQASARSIPIMIPQLADAIRDGKPIVDGSPNSLCRRINRVCRSCDLPEVGVHGLRHSFASLAYHLGWSERQTMEIGGWADTQTMHKIYTHLSRADRMKAQNTMADFYSKAR